MTHQTYQPQMEDLILICLLVVSHDAECCGSEIYDMINDFKIVMFRNNKSIYKRLNLMCGDRLVQREWEPIENTYISKKGRKRLFRLTYDGRAKATKVLNDHWSFFDNHIGYCAKCLPVYT